MELLRLIVAIRPADPLTGGYAVTGGCIAVALDIIRDRMVGRRDHLAQRYSVPPDPATLSDTLSEQSKRERLNFAMNQHREFLQLSTVVAEVEEALGRGADIERSEDPTSNVCDLLVHWSGIPIVTRHFRWAECQACGRRYSPEECSSSDWSRVADPLAGIGGIRLACPAGHTLYSFQTWVA